MKLKTKPTTFRFGASCCPSWDPSNWLSRKIPNLIAAISNGRSENQKLLRTQSEEEIMKKKPKRKVKKQRAPANNDEADFDGDIVQLSPAQQRAQNGGASSRAGHAKRSSERAGDHHPARKSSVQKIKSKAKKLVRKPSPRNRPKPEVITTAASIEEPPDDLYIPRQYPVSVSAVASAQPEKPKRSSSLVGKIKKIATNRPSSAGQQLQQPTDSGVETSADTPVKPRKRRSRREQAALAAKSSRGGGKGGYTAANLRRYDAERRSRSAHNYNAESTGQSGRSGKEHCQLSHQLKNGREIQM